MTALRVQGGAGGTVAVLEDLEHAAELLRHVAVGLLAAAARVAAASAAPGWTATVVVSPGSFHRAATELVTAVAGPHGVGPQAVRAELLGDGVATAARAYRAADSAAEAGVEAAATALGRALGPRVLGGALPVLAVAGGLAALGEGRPMYELTRHGGAVEWFADVLAAGVGAPPGPEPGSGLALATLLAGGATALSRGTGGLLDDSSRGVRVHVEPALNPVPLRGLADVVRRVPSTDETVPRVRLERIDSPRGRSWLVALPGTSSWGPRPGRDPFDLTSDVALMAGRRAAVTDGVLSAMREAGIRRGEPVLLAGHSLGGLIAASIAADPVAGREFTVTHVVTFGAPVASVPVPPDVQMLSLEHDEDVVPHLDGEPNPDGPGWITVQRSVDEDADVARLRSEEPAIAHELGIYAGTAEQVDASHDPSLRRWRDGAGAFLASSETSNTETSNTETSNTETTVTAYDASLTR